MKSKIAILGSSGFIGKHLVNYLHDKYEVITYDKKLDKDILDTAKLKKAMAGCKAVVHLAAFVSVSDSWNKPNDYYLNNVVGTSNVIEVAKSLGIKKIVFASSSAVHNPYSSPYAATKAMNELLFETNRNLIVSVGLRFFNVYGSGQNPAYGAAIPEFIKGIKEKGEIIIYGDGGQTRDFIFVDDICRAIEKAIELKLAEPTSITFDVGTGEAISINNLAELIMNIVGKRVPVIHKEARPEIKHSQANITMMRKLLSFKPKIDIYEGLEILIQNGGIL